MSEVYERNHYFGKNIVITGTGSWATEIIKQLLPLNPKSITAFSRNELAVVTKKKLFKDFPNVKIEIGDITNINDCRKYFKGADYVFCTSALKHVSIAENNPSEAIRVNIEGSQNIIKACEEHNVKNVILVSTDKACEPVNTYGLTKAIVEKLWLHQATVSENNYFVFRAGNVLNSNGSVIPIFKEQIEKGLKLTITDKNVTRFFITLEEVVQKLLKIHQISGTITIPKMNSYKIIDLAFLLWFNNMVHGYITVSSFNKSYSRFIEEQISLIGLQQGEKLHEVLVSDFEKEATLEFNSHYTYFQKISCKEITPQRITSKNTKDLMDLYYYLKSNDIIDFEIVE